MKVIDLQLGGTAPLYVIVQFEGADEEEPEDERIYEEDEEYEEFYAELDAETEAAAA